jgi:hypothetical protein
MAVPRKTMRDIRTLSGKVDRIANSYMAYMQITCLEMEKARKEREQGSARRRVETLSGRLHEIESEKAALLRALAERGAVPLGLPVARTADAPPARPGFRLRY